jgi:hypothetical protein
MRRPRVLEVAFGFDPRRLRPVLLRSDAVFHPDGKQFAFSVSSSKQSVWVMENFLPKTGTAR